MTEASEFERHRARLFAVAYRMVGSATESEDIVQEAWLRWSAESRPDVRNTEAFLTRIVTRLCLDHLKSARVRREEYVGPWLPEPVLTEKRVDDPSAQGETTELVSLALLRMMEQLSPIERAVLLLHDVFEYSHAEIASMLDASSESCRRALSRARKQLDTGRKRFAPDRHKQREMIERFMTAARTGDVVGLRSLLAADVVARSDGGGKVTAATRPIIGRDAVSRLFIGLARKAPSAIRFQIHEINGQPATILFVEQTLIAVTAFEFERDSIVEVSTIVNPDKLKRLAKELSKRDSRSRGTSR